MGFDFAVGIAQLAPELFGGFDPRLQASFVVILLAHALKQVVVGRLQLTLGGLLVECRTLERLLVVLDIVARRAFFLTGLGPAHDGQQHQPCH
ncbi:hypothetical protein D3C73_1408270 [compost metagenome]